MVDCRTNQQGLNDDGWLCSDLQVGDILVKCIEATSHIGTFTHPNSVETKLKRGLTSRHTWWILSDIRTRVALDMDYILEITWDIVDKHICQLDQVNQHTVWTTRTSIGNAMSSTHVCLPWLKLVTPVPVLLAPCMNNIWIYRWLRVRPPIRWHTW